jgi:coiled-coil domain-containing protein 55
MQRYGLQLRKPAASSSSRPPPPARPLAAFADDGDDDVEAEILRQSSKKRALQKVNHTARIPLTLLPLSARSPSLVRWLICSSRGGVLAQVEEMQKKAIEEDPSVFAYDEVYDDMKEKAARPKMQAKVVRQVIIRQF